MPTANTGLGQYVMVIASRAGTPVGIGEAADFVVPTGSYSIVDITLEGYDHVETWKDQANAASPTCLAWDRKHGEDPIAFVPDDDHDCDGELSARDCDDAAFCHPDDTSCQPARELCSDNNTCAYGCMIQGNCVPRVCVPGFTCTNATCDNAPTLVDRFTCLSNAAGADHPQYFIGATAGEPCAAASVAVKLPNNRPCKNPFIEFQQGNGGWMFAVADAGNGVCAITLATTSSVTPFGPDRHVLISLDPQNSQDPRPTIFLGIEPDSVSCTHATPPIGTLVINDCH